MGFDKEAADLWKFGRPRPDLTWDETMRAPEPVFTDSVERVNREELCREHIRRANEALIPKILKRHNDGQARLTKRTVKVLVKSCETSMPDRDFEPAFMQRLSPERQAWYREPQETVHGFTLPRWASSGHDEFLEEITAILDAEEDLIDEIVAIVEAGDA